MQSQCWVLSQRLMYHKNSRHHVGATCVGIGLTTDEEARGLREEEDDQVGAIFEPQLWKYHMKIHLYSLTSSLVLKAQGWYLAGI